MTRPHAAFGWSVYELSTGIVIRSGWSSQRKNAINQINDRYKEGLVLEYYEPRSTRIVGEARKPYRPKPQPITRAQVKAWAGRTLSYTDWLVIRELEEAIPIPDAVREYRRAVREACELIENMVPIPQDYKDPRYWPIKE